MSTKLIVGKPTVRQTLTYGQSESRPSRPIPEATFVARSGIRKHRTEENKKITQVPFMTFENPGETVSRVYFKAVTLAIVRCKPGHKDPESCTYYPH